MSGSSARVYVVDDDPDLRVSVARWLGEAGYQTQAFPCGDDFLAAFPQLAPGCIVLDMLMPKMSGLELQRRLLSAGCHWPVIMLTGHATRPVLGRAMESGVLAFLEKPVREVELLAAVMRGEAQLLGKADLIPDPEVLQRLARLTRRERQVLGYVMQKKLNKQIAGMLGIAETTVKGYRRVLMRKLGVQNTTELLIVGIRGGLYTPPKERR